MKKILIIIALWVFFFNIFCLKSFSQILDYQQQNYPEHTIVIISIKDKSASLYRDSTDYIASQLCNTFNKIPGIRVLNVLSTQRALEKPDLRRSYKAVLDASRQSFAPTPEDLTKIGSKFNANNVMTISSVFDTQQSILYQSFFSKINVFNENTIKPYFDYNVYINLYDPQTGQIIWSETLNKRFIVNNFNIATPNLSSNPIFLKNFNDFTSKANEKISKSFEKYLKETEITSVQAKIIMNPENSAKTPALNENILINENIDILNNSTNTDSVPPIEKVQEGNKELSNRTLQTPYQIDKEEKYNLKSIKPDMESNILKNYEKEIEN